MARRRRKEGAALSPIRSSAARTLLLHAEVKLKVGGRIVTKHNAPVSPSLPSSVRPSIAGGSGGRQHSPRGGREKAKKIVLYSYRSKWIHEQALVRRGYLVGGIAYSTHSYSRRILTGVGGRGGRRRVIGSQGLDREEEEEEVILAWRKRNL